jgi:hypothetical protein
MALEIPQDEHDVLERLRTTLDTLDLLSLLRVRYLRKKNYKCIRTGSCETKCICGKRAFENKSESQQAPKAATISCPIFRASNFLMETFFLLQSSPQIFKVSLPLPFVST